MRGKITDAMQTNLHTKGARTPKQPALAKAHRELDKAVDRCYRSKAFRDEQERLEFLFARYEKLIATS